MTTDVNAMDLYACCQWIWRDDPATRAAFANGTTLDSLLAALPDGWSVKIVVHKGDAQVTAWHSKLNWCPSVLNEQVARFAEADTPHLALARCVVAARQAGRSRK